jgi:hypothetical protein
MRDNRTFVLPPGRVVRVVHMRELLQNIAVFEFLRQLEIAAAAAEATAVRATC